MHIVHKFAHIANKNKTQQTASNMEYQKELCKGEKKISNDEATENVTANSK